MAFRLSFSALGLLCGMVLSAAPLDAGPLLPCISATLSANGTILVLNKLTFDDPDESHARYAKTSTFRIFPRYTDPGEGLHFTGPNAYWADPLWSVVFTKSPIMPCPYTLVTDDGEYLVLLNPSFAQNVLSIYRRRDHRGQPSTDSGPDHGVLVREIALSALWLPAQIPYAMSDSTPNWFASGTFAFSSDNRVLIHKTRWGKTFQISLATGEIKSQ